MYRVFVNAKKACGGSECIALLILKFCSVQISDHLLAPAASPQGKEPRLPIEKRLGGLQRHSTQFGEHTDVLALMEIETFSLGCPCIFSATLDPKITNAIWNTGNFHGMTSR
jgi:hypothetical protein